MTSLEIRLINLVKAQPEMYDVQHPLFYCGKEKAVKWARIAKTLKLKNGDEAKKMWGKLRNNFRNAVLSQLRRKKEGLEIVPWKFQSQMEFVAAHMFKSRKKDEKRMSFDDQHINGDGENEAKEDYGPHADGFEYEKNTIYVYEGESLAGSDVDVDVDVEGPEDDPVEMDEPPDERPNTESADIQKEVQVDRCEPKDTRTDIERVEPKKLPSDALYLFFMSMYEQTKTMPSASQYVVKRNIFNIVSQEEGRLLNIIGPRDNTYP